MELKAFRGVDLGIRTVVRVEGAGGVPEVLAVGAWEYLRRGQ